MTVVPAVAPRRLSGAFRRDCGVPGRRVPADGGGSGSQYVRVPDLGARAAGRGEGRVATSNDGKAAVSYTYNGTDASGKAEYRGLVTATRCPA